MADTLARYYAGWSIQNDRLRHALKPLTPEQLLLRSAPHMWTVSVLYAHLIGARVFWFHNIMHEGSPELEAYNALDDLEETDRPHAVLQAGLDASWEMINAMLNRCAPANLDDTFPRHYADGRVKTFTRQSLILRVLGHDHHHGGELSTVLGMHGLVGLED
jgi:uncharacterized damage-inducible protein DinB